MLDMDSVYREYVTVVYKFLLSLCYEEDMAEELTQETFYQAVRSANRYDGSCKVSTWLCQIAKHLWYQEVEHRKRKGTSPLTEDILSKDMPVEDRFNIRKRKWNYSGKYMFWTKLQKKWYFCGLPEHFRLKKSVSCSEKMKIGPELPITGQSKKL